MTDAFLVDVRFMGNTTIEKRNHRISFKDNYMEILGRKPGDESQKIYCTQFQYKELKTSNNGCLTIPLLGLPDSPKGLRNIKLQFSKEHEQFSEWVVREFNKMIQANKDEMMKNKPKKKPITVIPSNNSYRKESKVRPLYSEKACLKEIRRQSSYSDSSQSSSVPHSITTVTKSEKLHQPSPNFSNEFRSRSDRIDPNGKNDRKKTPPVLLSQADSLVKSRDHSALPEYAPPGLDSVLKSSESLPKTSPPHETIQLESPTLLKYKETPPKKQRKENDSAKTKSCSNSWQSIITASTDRLREKKLENTGNSCYFNSTMQVLSACYAFSTRCVQLQRIIKATDPFATERDDPTTKNEYSVFAALVSLISHLCGVPVSGSSSAIPSQKLSQYRREIAKINKDFDNDRQHDAHEYLLTLLGAVDDFFKEIKKSTQDGGSKHALYYLNPADGFKFSAESMYVCQSCNKSETIQNLQTDMRFTVRGNDSIQDMLKSLREWTPLERKCNYCKFNVSSSSERMTTFPQSLIIYLKLYEVKGDSYVKTKHAVEPSFEIDLSSLSEFTEVRHSELEVPDIDGTKVSPLNQEVSEDVTNCNVVNSTEVVEDKNIAITVSEACQNDVIVEKVSTRNDFKFKLLNDIETVERILHRLDITCDEEKLRTHLRSMEEKEEGPVVRTDPPKKTVTISADGNCFFRAISWCLTGSQKYHKQLRESTVKYLKESEKLMKKYCDDGNYTEHLEKMKEDGEWATSCEIFAMANLLNVKIMTYLKCGWVSHIPSNSSPSDGSIFLKNTSYHFEPTISVKNAGIRPQTFTEDKNEDDFNSLKKKRKRSSVESETNLKNFDDSDCSNRKPKNERPSTSGKKIEMENTMVSYEPMFYDLMAVICHIGESPNIGHYVAYIKDLEKHGTWLYCSDDVIEEAKEDRVASAIRQSGYIFFYDRKSL